MALISNHCIKDLHILFKHFIIFGETFILICMYIYNAFIYVHKIIILLLYMHVFLFTGYLNDIFSHVAWIQLGGELYKVFIIQSGGPHHILFFDLLLNYQKVKKITKCRANDRLICSHHCKP